MLNIKQAAEYCNRSENTIYRWTYYGLEHDRLRFLESDLDEYIANLKKGRPPKEIDSAILAKRYENGETADQISKDVNLTKPAILHRLRQMGVKIRQTGFKKRSK